MNKLLLAALLLVGCGEKARVEKMDAEWNKAEMIDVKYYKSNADSRYLQTFEIDGYKFVIYYNYRGSAMAAIPLDQDAKVKELEEYIARLEEENQLLGSLLAEKEAAYE